MADSFAELSLPGSKILVLHPGAFSAALRHFARFAALEAHNAPVRFRLQGREGGLVDERGMIVQAIEE